VLAHAPGSVTEDFMTILELDPEHRVRQQFHHFAAHFEEFFFGHAVSVSLCPELRAHSVGREKREGPRSGGSDSPDTSVTLYYPSRLAWLVQCSKDTMGLAEFVWGTCFAISSCNEPDCARRFAFACRELAGARAGRTGARNRSAGYR